MFFESKNPADYKKELTDSFEKRNEKQFDKIVSKMIRNCPSDSKELEALLGWEILSACELKYTCAGTYLPWFLKQYPKSLMPLRIEYSRYLLSISHTDVASETARTYLRDVRDAGFLKNLDKNPFVRKGTGEAFLILTASYTMTGARSYSRRVLHYAKKLDLEEQVLSSYFKEMAQFEKELEQLDLLELDNKWEAFFGGNIQYTRELFDYCKGKGFELLAKRVDLLDANFRFNTTFKVDVDEIFLLALEVNTGKKVALALQ